MQSVPNRLTAAWKAGVALEPASRLLTGVRRPRASSKAPTAAIVNYDANLNPHEMSQRLFEMADPLLKGLTKAARYGDACRATLIHLLSSGDLVAVGFRAVPPSDNPERIPAGLFTSGRIDWGKSAIQGNSLAFSAIRVVRPEDVPRVASNAVTDPIKLPSKKTGRPSVTNDLVLIVRELKKAGKLQNLSRKMQQNMVRELARERFPSKFPSPSQPSRTKILQALAAEGFGPEK